MRFTPVPGAEQPALGLHPSPGRVCGWRPTCSEDVQNGFHQPKDVDPAGTDVGQVEHEADAPPELGAQSPADHDWGGQLRERFHGNKKNTHTQSTLEGVSPPQEQSWRLLMLRVSPSCWTFGGLRGDPGEPPTSSPSGHCPLPPRRILGWDRRWTGGSAVARPLPSKGAQIPCATSPPLHSRGLGVGRGHTQIGVWKCPH